MSHHRVGLYSEIAQETIRTGAFQIKVLWTVSIIIDFPTFKNVYIDETIIGFYLGFFSWKGCLCFVNRINSNYLDLHAFLIAAERHSKCSENTVDSDRPGSEIWFHCWLTLYLVYLVYFFEFQFSFEKTRRIII